MAGIGDLGGWFKKRLDDSQGVFHQVNPFDGGRTFDTNRRGAAPFTPPADFRHRNVFQKGFDQVNPFDGGRTWQDSTPNNDRSVFGQATHNGITNVAGDYLFKPIANTGMKSINTVGAGVTGVVGLANVGRESLFGTDESYRNAVSATNMAMDEILRQGVGNRGAYLTPEQAGSSGGGWQGMKENFIKPTAQGVTEIAPLVIPIMKPAAGASLGAKAASMGGQNAAVGAGTTGMQQAINGDFDAKQLITNTAVSGVIGAGFPIAGAMGRKGVQVSRDAAPVVQQQMRAVAADQGGFAKIPGKGNNPIDNPVPNNGAPSLDDLKINRDRLADQWADAKPAQRQSLENQINQLDGQINQFEAGPPPKIQLQGGPSGVRIQGSNPMPDAPLSTKPSNNGAFTEPHLNTSKYNVTEKARTEMDNLAETMRPDIEARVGRKLGLDEIRTYADATGKVLGNARTREATLNYNAQLLNLREQLAALVQKKADGTATPADLIELNKANLRVKAAAADAGRTLNAFRNEANPIEKDVMDVMIDKMVKKGHDLDEVSKALDDLGPNPTNQQIAEFYRKFEKASFEDWLDKYRYTNMLSSPLTHIVNMASNAQSVLGVAPAQKVVEGALDATRAAITGGPRTRFAGEAGSYYVGAAKALPEAFGKAKDVITGKKMITNPDMDSLRDIPLATEGAGKVLDRVFSIIPKMLEASDQFGMTVVKGGEKAALNKRIGKGVEISSKQVDDMAENAATYRQFRQELGHDGQGYVLDALDTIPRHIMEMRNSQNPIVRTAAKFTLPFVVTPTNIFKQGIEYSPMGITTIAGSADKTAQLAKATMGTAVVGTAAGFLAANGDLTFSEPYDPDQRNAFRAEGKQPYSVKIGGKWYGYSKMHPAIAFNLATVAAVKDGLDKGSIDDSTADKIMGAASGVIGFMRDQSYMKAVGDFTNILQSKDGSSFGDIVASQATNTLNQLVPFKSLQSWIGRQVDPTQRKVDYDAGTPEQIWQGLVKDVPGLNKSVPVRENPYKPGEPLTNPHPLLNSFSPIRVSDDLGFGNTTGLNVNQRQMQQSLPGNQKELFRRDVVEDKALAKDVRKQQELIKEGKDPSGIRVESGNKGGVTIGDTQVRQLADGKFYAKVGTEYKTFPNEEKAKQAVFADQFKNSGKKKAEFGDKIYLASDNEQGYEVKSKFQYEYDQVDSKLALDMDRAKARDDVGAWMKSAEQKYNAMQKLKESYDPETEMDKINDITKKMEDLLGTVEKYQEYGGFKKGKSGGKGGRGGMYSDGIALPDINTAPPSDLMAPVIPKNAYQAPTIQLKNKGGIRVAAAKSRGVKIKAPKKLKG